MGNISIKRVVGDAIANHLSTNIPGLAGKVSAIYAGPETMAPCLALKVLPESFDFDPSQADEVYEQATDDGKVVVDVGSFTGLFTLQLLAASPAEREQYEQAVLDLFLRTEGAPGTIFVNTPNLIVNGYASLYQAEIKARLESHEWNEEFSFESKRYSFLEISVDYPALTTYDAHTIESLQIALAKTDEDIASIADVDADYRAEVQIDGSTLKATP